MEHLCVFKEVLAENIMNVSCNIKKYRTIKKITQLELSYYSDCERATISNLERHNCDNISIKTLIKIAIALDTTLINLLEKPI